MIRTMHRKIIGRLVDFAYRILSRVWSHKKIQHGGACFKLGVSTSHEVFRALTFSTKEPETLTWIDNFDLNDGEESVFFDIGANIGIYSLYAAAKYADLRIYAFEPENQSFAALCKNISLNRMNIVPYMLALGDTDQLGLLNVAILEAGAGAASVTGVYAFVSEEIQRNTFEQGVVISRIDGLVRSSGILPPNYVKIDVDGAELSVLRGGEAIFKSAQCRGVLVEYGYKDSDEKQGLVELMRNYGFARYNESEWVDEVDGLCMQNFIFNK